MLSTRQKEAILRKAGAALPRPPEDAQAEATWAESIEALHRAHAAQRAARSLREADEALRARRMRGAGESDEPPD